MNNNTHQTKQEIPFERVLDFIEKDRSIPEDSFFYTRLQARMEREQSVKQGLNPLISRLASLRYVITGMAAIFLVAFGIALGTLVIPGSPDSRQITLNTLSGDDPSAMMLYALSLQYEEQILVIK